MRTVGQPDLQTENLAARIAVAAEVGERRSTFETRFPPLPQTDFAPPITWAQIERQLTFLSGTDRPRWEVAVLQKEAAHQSAEFFLQRLLILAWAIIDDAPDTAKAMERPDMS